MDVDTWQKWASPVWMDIDQQDTLNRAEARESDDEKHICPLQLDVIDRLIREFGLTHDAAAQALGRSRSAVSNLLRLLSLPEPVQELMRSGKLEMGHARALLALDPARQIICAEIGRAHV